MKRLLLFAILFAAAVSCEAQNTTVTATVTDPNTIPYAFSTGYAALVCPGNQAPTYNGFSVPTTFTITGFDGTGTFTQVLYDTNVLVPTGCGYKWHITYKDGVTNFITGLITSVHGSSVNESSVISAFAVLLPVAPVTTPPGGSNGQLQYNNSGTFGGVAGSAVTSATGAITLTAGADTTNPLKINSHSATQSAALVDISAQSAGTLSVAPVMIRGTGSGGFGPPGTIAALLDVQVDSLASAAWPLIVNNRTAGNSSVIGMQMPDNGVGNLFGGGAVGDGSGNFAAISFDDNQNKYGASNQPGSLAIAMLPAANGQAGVTIWRPLGSVGPSANNMFQIAVGTPGFPLAGFDSGGPAGTLANVNLFFNGMTSGTAKLGVAAVAGTPCTFVLPTASATVGQLLQSAAPSSGSCQTSWATGFTSCGTIAANGACSNTGTALGHCIAGIATLSTGTSTITGLSPAFTSSSSFFVTTNDITTIANPSKGVPASATTITFTGTGTDNISFVACGS